MSASNLAQLSDTAPERLDLNLSYLAGKLEKVALSAAALRTARQQVDTAPSEAQKASGNYAKGHVSWKGFGIAIENPKGSVRSGKAKDGTQWSIRMKHDYGYLKGYRGRDKDHLDVFLGPDLESELVHIVNQVDPKTRRFDEHKILVGFASADLARAGYLANYEEGWRGLGSIRQLSLADFRTWLKGDTTKRAADEIKAPVEHVRQDDTYSCGPVAFKSVFDEYGGVEGQPGLSEDAGADSQEPQGIHTDSSRADQTRLSDEAGADPDTGTPPEALVSLGRRHGFIAEQVEDMTVDALKALLDEGFPVIVDIQAWGDPEGYDERDDGHYVVAIGYDEKNIYFEDPSQEEEDGTGFIPIQEFEDRWKDEEDPSRGGEKHDRLGIVLYKPGMQPHEEDVGNATKIAAAPTLPELGKAPMEAMKPNPHFSPELTHMGTLLGVQDPAKPKKKKGKKSKRRGRTKRGAVGIPDRSQYGDLSRLTPGELMDFVVQEHNAQRAGLHHDIRFGNKAQGLYSWATRKGLPEPGRRHALFQQPLHQHDYMNFQGTLKGYGAGTVRTRRKGQVMITSAEPGKIEFTTADEEYPQRFVLLKPPSFKRDTDWLMANVTPNRPVPYNKVHMTKIPAEKVEESLAKMQPGTHVQAKIDGAHSLVKLLKDGVEVISYRTSQVTGRPIVHTERVLHGRPKMAIPPDLVGTILKGELYGLHHPPTPQGAGVAGEPRTADAGNQADDGVFRDASMGTAAGGAAVGDPRGRLAPVREGAAQGQQAVEGVGEGGRVPPVGGREGLRPPGIPALHVGGQLHHHDRGGEYLEAESPGGAGGGLPDRGQRVRGVDERASERMIGPQELGGLLNSTLANSIAAQKERNIKLRIMLHNIQQLGRKRIDPRTVSYADRLAMVQRALQHLPADTFHMPEPNSQATTPESATRLWQSVRAGEHPLTHEGIVFHPPTGKPSKAKLTEDTDVHVTGIFPGQGKYNGVGAGGFEYALTPGGPKVGRVGTGLSDQLRKDLFANPTKYIGRVARIRSQEQHLSGAYRAPSLIAFHEDYPTTAVPEETEVSPKLACDTLGSLIDLGIVKLADDEEEKVPTVAVDLDGTLAEIEEPFDPKHIGSPRPAARKWLNKFRRAGARIIIFTVRGDKERVEEWLDKHRMPYDFINENPDQPEDSSGKVIADVYWDDRAVSAEGQLSESGPEVLERLKAADDGQVLVHRDPEVILGFIKLLREAA